VSFYMKKAVFALSLLVLPLLLLLACAGEPTQQMTEAKDALQKAQQAEADKYAPDLYLQAQNSIAEAESLIAMKKYTEAKTSLEKAKEMADQATTQAPINKDNTKTEVEDYLAAINGARKQFQETQNLAKQWRVPKDKWELTDQIATWDEDQKQVQADYDAGNYFEAKQLAAKLHGDITEKDTEIRDLIMAKQK
jgi:tetratricopeptide (TPR) repeat protein